MFLVWVFQDNEDKKKGHLESQSHEKDKRV